MKKKQRGYTLLATGIIFMLVGVILVGATILSLSVANRAFASAGVESGSPSGATVQILDVKASSGSPYGGTQSAAGTSESLDYCIGDTLEYIATAPSGYQFSYWQGVGYDTHQYTENQLEMITTGATTNSEGAIDTTYYAYFSIGAPTPTPTPTPAPTATPTSTPSPTPTPIGATPTPTLPPGATPTPTPITTPTSTSTMPSERVLEITLGIVLMAFGALFILLSRRFF